MSKKLLLPVILGIVLVLGVAGIALAQTATPPGQGNGPANAAPQGGLGAFNNFPWPVFDAAAKALNLTPAQLFEQLHSGKTLAQVAQAQGVPLANVQSAVQSAAVNYRKSALSNWINQAEQAGRITADQANWLRQGLQNGWLGRGLPFLGNRLPFLGNGLRARPGMPGNFGGRRVPRLAPQSPSATATPNFQ